MKKIIRSVFAVLVVLWAAPYANAGPTPAAASGNAAEVAPGLKVGDWLDQSNWQKAKDLLPPEILHHYQTGEYRSQIIAYPTGTLHWEKAFDDATARNVTTLAVDMHNTIVDRKTGKQPPYYYGLPFPKIDPNDPQAGVKIVWNQFLAYWAGGDSYNRTAVVMLNPHSVDRTIIADGWFNFFDGQGVKYREANPLNLESQFLGVVSSPTDLQGTASLTWRFRDPGKRDAVWAYVPALRRVRAVSPANRSDGYLGSDISGDDGFFFDGKPEDFDFKLVGQRDGLRLVDPGSVGKTVPITSAPGGGWVVLTNLNPPTVGYRIPSWKGAYWAPVGPALAKRHFWIVDVVPHDKYYLYGRIELWIDSETWDGAWNRKFSWNGELVNTYQLLARIDHEAGPASNPEWLPAGTMAYACAENVKMNRATVSGIRPDGEPHAAYYRRVPLRPDLFDSAALARFGK